ncbi:MAG: hypothetical protein M5U31_16320 [Acidimicrobiia bacterium]|nr:hypothetical protein [Acidimicrobiia bacterium]
MGSVGFGDDGDVVLVAELVEDLGDGSGVFFGGRVAVGKLVDRTDDKQLGVPTCDEFGEPRRAVDGADVDGTSDGGDGEEVLVETASGDVGEGSEATSELTLRLFEVDVQDPSGVDGFRVSTGGFRPPSGRQSWRRSVVFPPPSSPVTMSRSSRSNTPGTSQSYSGSSRRGSR